MATGSGKGKGRNAGGGRKGVRRKTRASSRDSLHAKKKPARKKSATTTKRSKRRSKKGGIMRRLMTAKNLGFAFTTLLTLVILGLLALAYFMHDLPDISSLTKVTKTPSILLQTEDGDIIGSSGDIYGEYVRYNDIPRDLIKAVMATEDRNFFRHFGVDPWGLLRAMVANVKAGRIVQGGSTITQQLAKNVFLTPERSLKRKVQELIIALAMERKYSKEQIITVYMNRVYFGAGTYGIDAAARRYFDKPASKLLLPESALIAGLLKAPSRYAPTSNRELAIGRATQVLINMVDAGLLKQEQMDAAKNMYSSLSFPEYHSSSGQRYYIDWVLDQIPEFVGNINSDLIVTTTFNPTQQELAEAAITQILTADTMKKRRVDQVALLSMTPNGAVQAMVGGRNYTTSQYNRATQARRQPGSSFKLFVYLAALQSGWHPYDTIEDAPININGWRPGNYNGRYAGVVTLRQAFEESLNTVAVRLSESVGRNNVIDMARRLGLKGSLDNLPSIALGVTESTLLEMTTAYAHMASNGKIVLPYGITSIKDVYGNVIYQRRGASQGTVIANNTVRQMNDMLLSVVESGTGRAANIGRPVAGKTGTSQDYKDAWFIGFAPQLITGVWVGNDNNTPTAKVTGGNLPAQIWAKYMQPALKGAQVQEIPRSGSGGGIREWWGNATTTPANDNRRNIPPPKRRNNQQRESFWDSLFSSGGEIELERDKNVPNNPRHRNDGGIKR
ncbi:MAG: PBP1A family penicillin-binding protein [Alphaproteobacteria bacterium]|nr:PBP1A family penicillin-binding protein [Alphaproteobacteria bacterium]